MKTLVEFFDNEPLKNIFATMIYQPEKVILVYDHEWVDELKKKGALRLIKKKNPRVVVEECVADYQHYERIQDTLRTLVKENEDLCFNFTGGRELVLVAAGDITAKQSVSSFYVNLMNYRFVNLSNMEKWNKDLINPDYLIEDVIESTGANMERQREFEPDFQNPKELQMIRNVYKVMMDNIKGWPRFGNYLANMLSKEAYWKSDNVIEIPDKAQMNPNDKSTVLRANRQILRGLSKAGVILFVEKEGMIQLRFQRPELIKLFKDPGSWLEYYVYLELMASKAFDDVEISARINWRGEIENMRNPKCEIDLIALKRVVPLFISCKISQVKQASLYEIRLMASRFGGEESIPVVITASDFNYPSNGYLAKAEELGIKVVDFKDLKKGELVKKLVKFTEKPRVF